MTARSSPRRLRLGLMLACAMAAGGAAQAAVIGRNVPAEPLTPARVERLPPHQGNAWRDYLRRSAEAKARDGAVLAQERRVHGASAALPSEGDALGSMPLDRPAGWYAGPEARQVAEVIISFQTPAGGWGKNRSRAGPPRRPGQPYASDRYVGTLDNGATVTELRFLARVIAADRAGAARAVASFDRGVRYLVAAQYPNGGWPQVWPLAGGYHDAVTLNDDAMVGALAVLGETAAGAGDFAFVDPELRRSAKAAWRRGLDALLAAQVRIGGRRAGWPQHADALTLAPAGGRAFEPPALATSETAGILAYLMSLDPPSPAVAEAVRGGVAWLASARLADRPGPGPLWPRYVDLATGRPIFGDRDLTVHDDVAGISRERRDGYAWFGAWPAKVLDRYPRWSARNGASD